MHGIRSSNRKMWRIGSAPLIASFLLLTSLTLAAASPLWGLDQFGAYLSGIFRSVVGPLFGFGSATNITSS
nr:uncharacterized protein LOC108131596 [Drosophila bipectinata]